MADFEKALRKVLRHEGVVFGDNGEPLPNRTGYHDDPDDAGGETNYGVTLEVAREMGYNGPMAEIPFDNVKAIYRYRFWNHLMGDKLLDQAIAREMFDTAVNCNVPPVVRMLQRVLNALNKDESLYPDLKEVDGKMGEKTLAALNAALKVAPWYREVILTGLDSLQFTLYLEITERRGPDGKRTPKARRMETYFPGWTRQRTGRAT